MCIRESYDVSSYKKPANPTLDDMGGVKLASNKEEELLLELLPTVANGFLKRRRAEECDKVRNEAEAAKAAAEAEKKAALQALRDSITGPVLTAPMGGTVVSVNVKPGQAVKKGDILLVYEAMKMENDVEAEKDSVIKRVFVEPGEIIGTEALLIEFE